MSVTVRTGVSGMVAGFSRDFVGTWSRLKDIPRYPCDFVYPALFKEENQGLKDVARYSEDRRRPAISFLKEIARYADYFSYSALIKGLRISRNICFIRDGSRYSKYLSNPALLRVINKKKSTRSQSWSWYIDHHRKTSFCRKN